MALLAIISIMAAESSMATGFTFILSAKVVQGERKTKFIWVFPNRRLSSAKPKVVQGERKAKRIKEYLTFLNLSQPSAKPKVVQGERKTKRIKEYLTFLNLSQPLVKPNERAFSPLLFFKQSYPVSETLQPFRTEFRQAALCLLNGFLLLGMGFGEELVGIANQLFFQGDRQEVLVG